jgi:phosphoglycerate dehydrogenase-like enzyme
MVLPATPMTYRNDRGQRTAADETDRLFDHVGRGSTLWKDLIQALEEKWIAGAALDCFMVEPLPKESKLWGLPNVIITPHVAGVVEYYFS